MATTFMDKQKNALIKKFHTLLTRGRISNDQKLDMLSGYGVGSTKDLTVYELTELCDKLDKLVNPELAEADKLRKRLIAAISSYRQAMGGAAPGIDEIKGIACRAARIEHFNRIPVERLRSLYSAFTKMNRDLQNVKDMTRERLNMLTSLN